jgi:hypothetical protein
MKLLTYTPTCPRCRMEPSLPEGSYWHTPPDHNMTDPGFGYAKPTLCKECSDAEDIAWRADTQDWIDHHSVTYRIDGKTNRIHVKGIKDLFPKESKPRAVSNVALLKARVAQLELELAALRPVPTIHEVSNVHVRVA